ncbi:MAG: flagellar hook-length control protein FliK [Oscillospiraceae bacterium]|jgi:flagellar hook-length control protein FliK|nr:flagellar hook-length control protein FliK [Oscillospiraceae bacterium]
MQAANLIFTAGFVPTIKNASSSPAKTATASERASFLDALNARGAKEAALTARRPKGPAPAEGVTENSPARLRDSANGQEASAASKASEAKETAKGAAKGAEDVTKIKDDLADGSGELAETAAIYAALPITAPPAAAAEEVSEVSVSSAPEQNDVSILGGLTTDRSLPGQDGETVTALPPELRDTARMPENPATDTVNSAAADTAPAPAEPEPCPPENVNVKQPQLPSVISATEIAPEREPASIEAQPEPAAAVSPAPSPGKPERAAEEKPSEDGGDKDASSSLPGSRTLELAPERVAADGALREASASSSAPVSRENIIPEMIERLQIMAADGQKTMSIDLKPEFLGKVSMTLVSAPNGVSVKILADDPGVRSLINGEIAGIIERMSERGIRVSGVELSETGFNGAEFSAYGSSPGDYSGGDGRGFGAPRRSGSRTVGRLGEIVQAAPAIEEDEIAGTRRAAYMERPVLSRASAADYGNYGNYGNYVWWESGDAYESIEYSA